MAKRKLFKLVGTVAFILVFSVRLNYFTITIYHKFILKHWPKIKWWTRQTFKVGSESRSERLTEFKSASEKSHGI